MSATARVHTGALRARSTATASPRTSPRTPARPTRRTGPVHVRPA
ncbi:MAG: hypothetical protein JWQ53_9, partial [Klenkia sp.]|nr:hypothetical protein [Klenkia sp.]